MFVFRTPRTLTLQVRSFSFHPKCALYVCPTSSRQRLKGNALGAWKSVINLREPASCGISILKSTYSKYAAEFKRQILTVNLRGMDLSPLPMQVTRWPSEAYGCKYKFYPPSYLWALGIAPFCCYQPQSRVVPNRSL